MVLLLSSVQDYLFKLSNNILDVKYITSGGQSHVFKVLLNNSNEILVKVAVDYNIDFLTKEYKILKLFEGESNICQLYKLNDVENQTSFIIDTIKNVKVAFLFLENHGDSITSLIGKTNFLGIKYFWYILLAVIEALMKLHSKGIIHRDISPNNICIYNSTNDVTLIDMGLSFENTTRKKIDKKGIGTKRYQPIKFKQYKQKHDIESLCYVLWEIFDRFTFSEKQSIKSNYKRNCNIKVIIKLLDYINENDNIDYHDILNIIDDHKNAPLFI